MPIYNILNKVINNIPEVQKPLTKLSFKEKLRWTLFVLVAFFILSVIPLYGLGQNTLSQFTQLSIILGASFGSIMSLGIGPIVTASIVLQLLVGSGILKIDLTTKEGKSYFQGLQKISTLFFIIFEAIVYVFMGGLAPSPTLTLSTYKLMQIVLTAQLFLGGLLVLYMDEITTKWGFGSGVSLFIAAGVSSEVFVRAFSILNSSGSVFFGSGLPPVGKVWILFISLINGDVSNTVLALVTILSTILVFALAVYLQALKVEIPLSFGRVRGFGIRWPLNFLYTSNIPVILVAALMANIQLWARLLERWGYPILGTFSGNTPATGLVTWVFSPQIANDLILGTFSTSSLFQALTYILFMVIGATIFSIFWMQTAGMDAKAQAKNIMASGLQIPGFRRDERILEHLLKRYILPLTVMGAIAVGLLASTADLLDALSRGTGLLLTVMIIYRLYEDIAHQHMMDMHPMLRNIVKK